MNLEWVLKIVNNRVVLLVIVLAAIWRLGCALFEEKKKVAVFELFTVAIYLMNTFLGGQSAVTGIFSDSPSGLTWLSCVVMPLALANSLEWMNEASEGKVNHKLRKVVVSVVLLVIAQLLDEKGGFYIALMLFVTAAVILVRKGYDYVITSGRFKKRI